MVGKFGEGRRFAISQNALKTRTVGERVGVLEDEAVRATNKLFLASRQCLLLIQNEPGRSQTSPYDMNEELVPKEQHIMEEIGLFLGEGVRDSLTLAGEMATTDLLHLSSKYEVIALLAPRLGTTIVIEGNEGMQLLLSSQNGKKKGKKQRSKVLKCRDAAAFLQAVAKK